VVTGRVERGIVKVGDTVEIVASADGVDDGDGCGDVPQAAGPGQAGDNIGVLLRGTKRDEVERGQVLAKPGSITPHTHFECEVYVLSKEEAGGTRRSSMVIGRSFISDDGRDGVVRAAGGHRDGDAWRQREDDGEADCADCDGGRAALCDSRGWPDVGAGVVAKVIE